MQMPGREFVQGTGKKYRYSINGQESSEELNDNLTTALFWEYDSRIVRRWNTDPVLKVWESPYLCFSGNPILLSDPNGDEPNGGGKKKKHKQPARTRDFKVGGLPVFLDELLPKNSQVHNADLIYSKSPIGNSHTYVLPSLPNIRFMLLHREGDKVEQDNNRTNSERSNKDVKNPQPGLLEMHEVPYAATKEAKFISMRFPVDATQNASHGALLNQFFRRNSIKDGDAFIVPLFDPTPSLVRETKETPSKAPALAPSVAPIILPQKIPYPKGQDKPSPSIPPVWRLNPLLKVIEFFLSPLENYDPKRGGFKQEPILA